MAVTAVVGCQWGDEGKGKVVDILSARADVVARYQGGPNAGHTVVVAGDQTILHQIPSGILHDRTVCCLGNGVVIDPHTFFQEMEELTDRGISVKNRLWISPQAHVIMPYHRAIDEASEAAAGNRKIGTTGRGIGPAYTDKYNRTGMRVADLLAPDFEERFHRAIEAKNRILVELYKASPLDERLVLEEFLRFREQLKPFAKDVSVVIYDAIRNKKNVILEGAQGTLLDIDHGTYPYVTSSNPTAGMAATGTGIGPRHIDQVLGVFKAYTTRVGNGPFPTEIMGDLQTSFREWGGEYGATTGRSRRCGWLDLVIAKYAARINSLDGWIITKLDVLSHLDEIKVCTSYKYKGQIIEHFPSESWILKAVEPVYVTVKGWSKDISGIREYGQLPVNCRNYLDYITEFTGVKINMVSVGPDRDAVIQFR
ncbi:adenylosuccinate synthase [bacterium]|nr:adenylosuccinate synthase [bacterium]